MKEAPRYSHLLAERGDMAGSRSILHAIFDLSLVAMKRSEQAFQIRIMVLDGTHRSFS